MLDFLNSNRSFLVLSGSQFFRLVFTGASFFLLSRHLGPEQFGNFISISALFYLFSPLVTFGLYDVNVKRASCQQTPAALLSASLITIALLSALVLPIALIVGNQVFQVDFVIILALALTIIIAEKAMPIAHSIFVVTSRFGTYAIIEILQGVLRLFAVLILLAIDGDLIMWTLLFLGYSLVLSLGFIIWALATFGLKRNPVAELIQRMSIGKGFLLATLLETAVLELDRVIVNKHSGASASGIYGAVMRINNFALMPINAYFITVYKQYFSKGQKRKALALRHALKVIRNSLIIAIIIFVSLIVFRQAIEQLLGPEYQGVASILVISALIPLVYAITQPLLDALSGTNHQNVRVSILAIVLTVNISLLMLLLPHFEALGAVLSVILSRLFILPLFVGYRFINKEHWL